MAGEAEQAANSIIAEALKNAGVKEGDIGVPEGKPQAPSSVPKPDSVPNPYTAEGAPKGEVAGELEEEEDTSPETEPPAEGKPSEPTVPAISKADIEAAINTTASRMQSLMDKRINQVTQQSNTIIDALNQFFANQETTSLSNLPENEQVDKRLERLEKGNGKPFQIAKIAPEQPTNDAPNQFMAQLIGLVEAVGLKLDDSRIDWGNEGSKLGRTDDAKIGFDRFKTSIRAALVEDQTKAIETVKKTGESEITKLRKKTGVDKISVTGPGGAGAPNMDKMTPFQKIEYGFAQQEALAQEGQK